MRRNLSPDGVEQKERNEIFFHHLSEKLMHPNRTLGGELIILYIGCKLKKVLALLRCEYTQRYCLVARAFHGVNFERVGIMVLVPLIPVWLELCSIPNFDTTAKSGINPVNEDMSWFTGVGIFL